MKKLIRNILSWVRYYKYLVAYYRNYKKAAASPDRAIETGKKEIEQQPPPDPEDPPGEAQADNRDYDNTWQDPDQMDRVTTPGYKKQFRLFETKPGIWKLMGTIIKK